MRIAKSSISARTRTIPELRFEDQQMTSFGGLVVFQKLFQVLDLSGHLKECCQSLDQKSSRFYNHSTILKCVIVHLLLGYRKLREMDLYRDDPLVQKVLDLKRLPSVPTVSRMLGEFDGKSVDAVRDLNRDLIISRLVNEKIVRVTLDFDGSVQSTTRHAEGSAVGFNKKKKGARSYYPLFCTIAQTGQIFDQFHRSGNVHDSNGACDFVVRCVKAVRAALPSAQIETRMDSAFFSDEMVSTLEALNVEYTISVPFERFTELKQKIESRQYWWPTIGSQKRSAHFQEYWKPKSWKEPGRFLFVRQKKKIQTKGPLQLDLFEPMEEGVEYKVIITNKKTRAGSTVCFHEGRGSQEKIFGEAKTDAQMDYIPARRRVANEVYLMCSVLAHNLARELQMQTTPPERGTTPGRMAKWVFAELSTIRNNIIRRAGRLTRPQGKLTLTLGPNQVVKASILQFMKPEAG